MSDRIGLSGIKLIIINFIQLTIFRFACERAFSVCVLCMVSCATGMTRAIDAARSLFLVNTACAAASMCRANAAEDGLVI